MAPLSSIVRRLYYHQRYSAFPRVVAGTPDLWSQGIKIPGSGEFICGCSTWSPCGQFIAEGCGRAVKIWDSLSSELLSTLTKSNTYFTLKLSYSPDGHFLALLSNNTLAIWDIQTGGMVKEVKCWISCGDGVSLAWSLDGAMIGIIFQHGFNDQNYTVWICDITSCTTQSPGELQSSDRPYLWVDSESFWAMAIRWDNKNIIIDIYKVGHALTKIQSFYIESWGQSGIFGPFRSSSILGGYSGVGSFSPTTSRISILVSQKFRVLDVQNSSCLLEQEDCNGSHSFSSDGSLFAASLPKEIQIWKYTSGHYIPWRGFPSETCSLQFSPTSLSITGYSQGGLKVWHLDSPPLATHHNSHTPLAILSHCGTYMVTGQEEGSVVTITHPLSETPSQVINTGIKTEVLALTGNVLLAMHFGMIVAWRLTEEGVVDGIPAKRTADLDDCIWAVSARGLPMFLLRDQVMVLEWEDQGSYVYHIGTGEKLEPPQVPPQYHYSPWDVLYGWHYSHFHKLDEHTLEEGWPVSLATLQKGWVEDPEGKYRLWIPAEWRSLFSAGWFSNITTLWLNLRCGPVIIIL